MTPTGFTAPTFEVTTLTSDEERLREAVRSFLEEELPPGTYRPGLGIGATHSPEFTKKLATRGWVGMAIPKAYGGSERSAVERFLVAEELLRAGAPISAHWIADRQTAPMLLAFGTEPQRRFFLPRIANGECSFAIGMSEPDTGSDLSSVKTAAQRSDGGWSVSGTKVWTSHAHVSDYFVVLCRTGPPEPDRHAGLSQLIVDLRSAGVQIRPITLLDGSRSFSEVSLSEVFVRDDMVLGQLGSGWEQVTTELTFERAGPDRYLSSFPLFDAILQTRRIHNDDTAALDVVGLLWARLWALRHMSLAVARSVDAGAHPTVQAALVKDLGTAFEQQLVDAIGLVIGDEPDRASSSLLLSLLAEATLNAPAFTVRGGTSEILRLVIARALGVGR